MREQKSRSPVRHRDSRGDSRSPPLRRKSADVDRHRKGGAHPREQHYTGVLIERVLPPVFIIIILMMLLYVI